jgi:hypothetical protein
MAITTLDEYIASLKQGIPVVKTVVRTSVAAIRFSVFDIAGNPGAGVLAGTSTAAGIVPTDATAGCPIINFASGSGYLSRVAFGNTVACRMFVSDMLFKAGAYSFNSNVTLAAQPSYSSRVPSGTNFTGTQIWLEAVTTFTGLQTVTITYTNQAGTTGRTTGAVATGVAPTLGRMFQMPLQAGDTGVQRIDSVISTVSTVGTFNVLVLRPLWSGRVMLANGGDTHGLDDTGMPEVFTTSALVLHVTPDSTSTGIPELMLEVASG